MSNREIKFTGLRDKKGKKIYEGDIVNAALNVKRVVEWQDGGFGWKAHRDDDIFVKIGQEMTNNVKVIGNIYENSELIEQLRSKPMTNEEIQAFVREKCGGLTLEHILSYIGDFISDKDFQIRKISYGGIYCNIEDDLLFWEYFIDKVRKGKPANLSEQNEKTQIAIAKLLGYKEKGGVE